MVCDSRYELTSKHPGRGRERGAGRGGGEKEREREARGGREMLEISEGREVRLPAITGRIKRG